MVETALLPLPPPPWRPWSDIVVFYYYLNILSKDAEETQIGVGGVTDFIALDKSSP